ncbi:hypothetical protein LTR70_006930 [Exophiala xenobiotica]|uniref:FAD-binding domain-containing protein n=1 Tax=Lithohypha guttulata TaxID=1690604 RepID=A0ABR0K5I7_9EURO|nr:hypothetical protein LTR24_006616 [Lithohypha guttulata]KAK5314889.1 hypothetical protein LTR70_006930 [Exophiala xenobiotica]
MATKKNFEIAIIGGGIAGLSLAIALHHRNVPVKIYEQAPKFGEIGAGVSFSPNAVSGMKLCHQGIYDAFERICTRNAWPSKQKVWFDYLNGYDKSLKEAGHQEAAFTITSSIGQNGVHRARFLEELVKLLPGDIANFGKRVKTISETESGKQEMHFEDGSTAEADAVIGSDGIKSQVRKVMFGENHPCAHPSYTHKYAYRGLVPMDQAVNAIGEERGKNSCMHMGPGGHVLTFPVEHGKILNVVAFRTDDDDWPDYSRLTRPAKREDALKGFEGYGPNVIELLKLTKPDLDVWAIFDLAVNPVPQFNKGRVCIVGDAAHATSPHHGAGAGFCIEDSLVMAELLADDQVRNAADIEAAFTAFDINRRERCQWLVRSSRFVGDAYEWRAPGVDDDFEKIESEINRRNGIIGNFDVEKGCKDAVQELAKLTRSSNL